MYTALINSQIKRTTKNLFVLNLILLIISAVILLGYWGEFHNSILGPKEVNIREINGGASRNYVKVTPEDKASMGLQYIDKEVDENNQVQSKTVESEYYVLKDGDNLIIASIPPEQEYDSSYTGWVRKMTTEESANLTADISDLKSNGFIVNEYILDASHHSIAVFWYVLCGIIIIINLIFIFKCIKYKSFPEEHKIYKKLRNYGKLDEVIDNIEEESLSDSFQNEKNIYFFKSWIIAPKIFSFNIIKIDDIVWAHKKVTRHSVNFIPTGKSYELILYFNNKSKCSVRLKEYQIDHMLALMKQMHPWIIIGFSDELRREWKSRAPQLINHVQDQKQKAIDNNYSI